MKSNYRNIVLWCGIVALATASCNKPDIEIPESNDPIFRADGTFADENFSLVAGDNNAYMFTMTESVHNVNVFSGKLSDGLFSVELGIYDGYIDKPNSVAMAEMSGATSVFSKLSSQSLMKLSKDSLPNNQYIQSIQWFVDGIDKGTNDAEIYEPGKYLVRADITFDDGETESLSNELIVGYTRSSNCGINFTVNTMGELTAYLEGLIEPVSSVIWTIDGVSVPGTNILQTTVSLERHHVRAEIHFSNTNVVRTKEFIIDPLYSWHNVHDFTVFETNAVTGIPQDFNVRLRVEKNGKVYLSETADNNNSSLEITGVTYYGKNNNGKDVYKISGNVSAKVREMGSLKTYPIVFSAVFGVEIP